MCTEHCRSRLKVVTGAAAPESPESLRHVERAVLDRRNSVAITTTGEQKLLYWPPGGSRVGQTKADADVT